MNAFSKAHADLVNFTFNIELSALSSKLSYSALPSKLSMFKCLSEALSGCGLPAGAHLGL